MESSGQGRGVGGEDVESCLHTKQGDTATLNPVYACLHVHRESVLSFYHVGSRYQTQVIGLGSKCPCLLSLTDS